MRRIPIFVIFVAILPLQRLQATVYELAGQITSGTTLFPQIGPTAGLGFEEFGLPVGGYPVDYVARLGFGAEPTDWTFGFTVTDDERSIRHKVAGPPEVGPVPSNSITNAVAANAAEISIDFFNFGSLGESFALTVDLANETGAWSWGQSCPVCDLAYALPSAKAMVSSFRVIPEPTSLCLTIIALLRLSTARRNANW